MKNIVALVDFTRISDAALAQAARIAQQASGKLILLHIAPEDQRPKEIQLKKELAYAAELLGIKQLDYELKICFGPFFDQIAPQLAAVEAHLVVVGTHGIRGTEQNIFSTNLVRLLNSLNVPKIVVQGQREMAPSRLDKWLMAGEKTEMDVNLQWLADAYQTKLLANNDDLKNEDLETEAFDNDCNLIVWKGTPEAGLNLILNGYGIPVLLI